MPVCIAGMHRSGTSLTTRALNLCGLYLGEEADFMPPAPDNPEGFWENILFVSINEDLLNASGSAWDCPPPLSLAYNGERFARIAANAEIHARHVAAMRANDLTAHAYVKNLEEQLTVKQAGYEDLQEYARMLVEQLAAASDDHLQLVGYTRHLEEQLGSTQKAYQTLHDWVHSLIQRIETLEEMHRSQMNTLHELERRRRDIPGAAIHLIPCYLRRIWRRMHHTKEEADASQ